MADANAAAIYDLGYEPYTGPRLGRAAVMRAMIGFSFRTAFGSGRGEKAKKMPGVIVLVVYLFATFQVLFASAAGMPGLINYANFLEFSAVLVALFAAAQAPELIVTDKQQGVLSLYLSRPITKVDYALSKVAALTAAMLVITLGPQLVLLLGKIGLAKEVWPALKLEWTKLFPIVGGTLLMSVFIASIALLLASFAARRGYATAAVIAFFLILPPVVDMFRSVMSGDLKRYTLLLHPFYLVMGFANWLFDIEAKRHTPIGRADLPGSTYMWTMLAVCVVCILSLLRRYRRLEA